MSSIGNATGLTFFAIRAVTSKDLIAKNVSTSTTISDFDAVPGSRKFLQAQFMLGNKDAADQTTITTLENHSNAGDYITLTDTDTGSSLTVNGFARIVMVDYRADGWAVTCIFEKSA